MFKLDPAVAFMHTDISVHVGTRRAKRDAEHKGAGLNCLLEALERGNPAFKIAKEWSPGAHEKEYGFLRGCDRTELIPKMN